MKNPLPMSFFTLSMTTKPRRLYQATVSSLNLFTVSQTDENPLKTHRPGWVDPRDNKHYYSTKKNKKTDIPYTNYTGKTRITDENDDTVPSLLKRLIHDDKTIEWALPQTIHDFDESSILPL